MEGFSYVDIFATKGIEYLLVIGFLGIFILFWKFLTSPSKTALEFETLEGLIPDVSEWFNLMDGLYYHRGHSWVTPERDDIVRVGMDDFAQKLIGRVNSIELPNIGSKLEQGDKGWRLNVDSKKIDMLSPVKGEVIEVNDNVLKSPDLLNKDPYEKGWLFKVKVPNTKSNLNNLITGKLAQLWLSENTEKLHEIIGENIGTLYQDGGILVSGIAKNLSPDKWDEIVAEFLLTK